MSNEWLLSPKKEQTSRRITATLGIGGAVATLLVFSLLFFTNVRFAAEGALSLSLHFSLLFFFLLIPKMEQRRNRKLSSW